MVAVRKDLKKVFGKTLLTRIDKFETSKRFFPDALNESTGLTAERARVLTPSGVW